MYNNFKLKVFEKIKQNLIYVILIVILGISFSYFSFFSDFFYDFIYFVEKYVEKNNSLSQLVFVLFSVLSAMLMPLSSTPLLPGAIVIWGAKKTFFLLLTGWMIGHSFSYLIARFALHPIMKKIIDIKKINYYKNKLSNKLGFALILLFCFASPAEILGYVLGMLRYSFIKYFIAVLISEIFFAILSIYASEAFLANNLVLLSVFLIIGFGIIIVAFYFFSKKLKKYKHL